MIKDRILSHLKRKNKEYNDKFESSIKYEDEYNFLLPKIFKILSEEKIELIRDSKILNLIYGSRGKRIGSSTPGILTTRAIDKYKTIRSLTEEIEKSKSELLIDLRNKIDKDYSILFIPEEFVSSPFVLAHEIGHKVFQDTRIGKIGLGIVYSETNTKSGYVLYSILHLIQEYGANKHAIKILRSLNSSGISVYKKSAWYSFNTHVTYRVYNIIKKIYE